MPVAMINRSTINVTLYKYDSLLREPEISGLREAYKDLKCEQ